MERQKRKSQIGIAILALFHLVGIMGLSLSSSAPFFERLVPLDLLLSLAILAYFHIPKDFRWLTFAGVIGLAGFFVEVLGIQSGWPFGTYYYDYALGPKIWGTPPLIGINWLILVYACGMISLRFPINLLGKSILGGGLMVFLDLLIEPVAIAKGFWHWETEVIPLQNYLAWFIIAVLFLLFFHYTFLKSHEKYLNPISYPFFIIQLIFFFVLGMLM